MREAVAFLTVLGGARTPTGRALPWFPAVGAVIGAAVGGVWLATGEVFPTALAAALAVAADLTLTGALHVDGLADSADGLLPHADRERRLEIMRAPDVGAFGIAAVGAVLLLRFAGFAARPADVLLIVGVWCAARTVVSVVPVLVPYARERGVASALLDRPTALWPALALLPAGALTVLGIGIEGVPAVAATVVVAVGVIALGRARTGGFTGDILGAAIVVGETAGLVVAGARW